MDEITVTTQNKRGEWVPAVPLPFFGIRKRCGICRRAFWTVAGYRGHYAYAHALGMESDAPLVQTRRTTEA